MRKVSAACDSQAPGACVRHCRSGRVAPLDQLAADTAGTLAASRKAVDFNVDFSDTLIAGIALSRHATLATRNNRHFSDLQIRVIDPWSS